MHARIAAHSSPRLIPACSGPVRLPTSTPRGWHALLQNGNGSRTAGHGRARGDQIRPKTGVAAAMAAFEPDWDGNNTLLRRAEVAAVR